MTALPTDPLIRASALQRLAAAPSHSVWVGASAGTGKTKVLTDRVLSLLLNNSPPQALLCLTFTKAAAAEMANRLNQRLAVWATAEDAALDADLTALRGTAPDIRTRTRARRLFAEVLDAPGGLAIQTLHSFCQSLLRRFPLEAGVAPHFQAMDDAESTALLAESRDSVLQRARNGADPALAAALAQVSALISEQAFPDVLQALLGERGRLTRLLARWGGVSGLAGPLRQRLGLEDDRSAEALLLDACSDRLQDVTGLRAVLNAILAAGSKSEKDNKAPVMDVWLAAAPEDRMPHLEDWAGLFLTDDDTIRKTLITKAVIKALPEAAEIMGREAERQLRLRDGLGAARLADATLALLTLGEALLDSYRQRKEARALLDYDDLILTAMDLLQRPGLSAWVLFKLDGGLQHVLIDEAQDTNPDQWAVIRALTAEFFAGEGRHAAGSRTIFAVGDAKQSIYSFQRADPRAFGAMRQRLAGQVPAAGGAWAEVPLDASFRSTAAVLQAVDLVFATAAGGDGVVPPGESVTHIPVRLGMAGAVELWPPLEPEAQDDPPAWKPPVERLRGETPRTRLARLLARRMRRMLDSGETLPSQGRAIVPGDLLVLVRRRNAFVEDLVRELKTLDIPVAGADRMVLTEQLAVMDLIALGRMLLLPEDDLTLACVLKSPLVGLSEEDLFALAHPRRSGVSLWQALRDAAAAGVPACGMAWERLTGWARLADALPPYDLYSQILDGGARRALLERLGMEAEDPLDEFLGLTLSYEMRHPPSLQGFLRWLDDGGVEIKRDLDSGGGAVRIMTVHGAKGLQAPIVFLPDTLQVPTRTSPLLWLDDPEDSAVPLDDSGSEDAAGLGWPLWAARAELRCDALTLAKDAARRAQQQEYRRLLYVAMTRAEDRLIVCGWSSSRRAEGNWYDLIHAALSPLAERCDDPFLTEHLCADPGDEPIRILRLSCPQTVPPKPLGGQPVAPADDSAGAEGAGRPDWMTCPAPVEKPPYRPLAPSRDDTEEPPVAPPFVFAADGVPDTDPDPDAMEQADTATTAGTDRLAAAGQLPVPEDRAQPLSRTARHTADTVRFRRGRLIHSLLQTLPDLPEAERVAAACRWLARPAWDLSPSRQRQLLEEVMRILTTPAFAPLFGPDSRAEVPLTGLIGTRVISGVVDRLVIRSHDVLILDYKTNRPPPLDPAEVPALYLKQMAAYRAVLKRIYPDRQIRCVLLWTDAARLMELDDDRLEAEFPVGPSRQLSC